MPPAKPHSCLLIVTALLAQHSFCTLETTMKVSPNANSYALSNHKRGREAQLNSSRRAVVFSPYNHSRVGVLNAEDCQCRLADIVAKTKQSGASFTSNLERIQTVSKELIGTAVENRRSDAINRIETAETKLETSECLMKAKLSEMNQLQGSLTQWKMKRQEAVKSSNNLEEEISRLESCNAQLEQVIQSEVQRSSRDGKRIKQKANRLQQQISYYAGMTGIKWDFEAQEKYPGMLLGQVVRTVYIVRIKRYQSSLTFLFTEDSFRIHYSFHRN